MSGKPQRIRDPLHNLIEFSSAQFDQVMWKVIQTPTFQRLRRIRQLGFSEFVYPGATHTRFAHSIGVYHTACNLMKIIKNHLKDDFKIRKAEAAIAAALVHDVGHGMFSHSFEDIGKKLGIEMAKHESVSGILIRDTDIGRILNEYDEGFAENVAKIIEGKQEQNIYGAVVSSQFDADRLDYMQRDRLMSGVQNSGIDLTWLMANLEIGKVSVVVDEIQTGEIETFVLGPKAIHAADSYVLGLFQLYPTIYYHKATRAAEKVFSVLMILLINLIKDGDWQKTGLPEGHPIVRFAQEPDKLSNVLALDDTVFWGTLSMLIEAENDVIKTLAKRLQERNLPKCIDIREELVSKFNLHPNTPSEDRKKLLAKIKRICEELVEKYTEWSDGNLKNEPRIFIDIGSRNCYKQSQDSNGPLNQIRIRKGTDIIDIFESSSVVRGQETFHVFRVYTDENDQDAKDMIKLIKEDVVKKDREND